jgi:hypothetical protein
MMRPHEQELRICLLDNALRSAALTRAHAGFGELRPPRCTLHIIQQHCLNTAHGGAALRHCAAAVPAGRGNDSSATKGEQVTVTGKVKFFNEVKGYTFNSADNGAAVLIYYSYTIASGNKISLANQLAGPLPMFEVSLKETFNYFGTAKDLVVKLNACVAPKLSLPFSNQKFTVAEFDFQAIADASNNIGTISLSE